jgi:hypothetical protein
MIPSRSRAKTQRRAGWSIVFSLLILLADEST